MIINYGDLLNLIVSCVNIIANKCYVYFAPYVRVDSFMD